MSNGTGWTEADLIERLNIPLKDGQSVWDVAIENFSFHFSKIKKPLTLAMGDGKPKFTTNPLGQAKPTLVKTFEVRIRSRNRDNILVIYRPF